MILFIDSDVLLDAILIRAPFDDFAIKVLSLVDREDYILYASAHSLLNVYYVASKIAGKTAAMKSISLLEQKLNIAPTHNLAVRIALSSDFNDFEDAVQYAIALENKCKIIVTRNIRDYTKSSIPVMTAEQYIKSIY